MRRTGRIQIASTNAALLSGGRVVVLLADAAGQTVDGVPALTGRTVGLPPFRVVPGAAFTLAWQVNGRQDDSAWLEAEAIVESVEGRTVAVRGAGSCRASRDPRPQ